jgi:two-component system response regulator YesN
MGNAYDSISSLSTSLSECELCMKSRAVMGCNKIIHFYQLPNHTASPIFPECKSLWGNISQKIEFGEPEGILQAMNDLFCANTLFLEAYPYVAYSWFLKMIYKILEIFSEFGFAELIADIDMPMISDKLNMLSSLKQLREFCLNLINNIFKEYNRNIRNMDSKVIQKAKQYIAKNYGNRIELEDIAQCIFLSPAYLGILFKRETGQTFTEYVTDVRIKKAKELLQKIELNISDIAQKVGYKDARYFIKVFKRLVGITPSEYRKLYHHKMPI